MTATVAAPRRRANTFDSDSSDDECPSNAANLRASLAQVQQALVGVMENIS
jgi:hypothetical protein